MITPFDTRYAQAAIAELTEIWELGAVSGIMLYIEPPSEDMPEEQRIAWLVDDIDTEYGTEMWTALCLLDDAVNGTGYVSQCFGYAEQYTALLETLQADLAKKKFLTRKPVHDLQKLLRYAVDALDGMMGKGCTSELLDEMRQQGKEQEYLSSLLDLQSRLRSQIKS